MPHSEKVHCRQDIELFTDPTLKLDIATKIQEGNFLRVIGLNSVGQPAKPHEPLSDIGIVIGRNNAQNFTISEKLLLKRDIATNFPMKKTKYVKRMVCALADRSKDWYEQYSLSDIVDAIHSLSDYGDNHFQWIFDQQGGDWLDQVISEINNDDYNRTWDFERRRQDGPDYYEEWRRDTNDQRN